MSPTYIVLSDVQSLTISIIERVLLVSNELKSKVVINGIFWNIEANSLTLLVSNKLKSRLLIPVMLANIEYIVVTFEVSQLFKSKLVNISSSANNKLISVTLDVSKFSYPIRFDNFTSRWNIPCISVALLVSNPLTFIVSTSFSQYNILWNVVTFEVFQLLKSISLIARKFWNALDISVTFCVFKFSKPSISVNTY